jgi:2-polyprenyl-3-methyl-5-hydroxy-6-metoxy-1,4-benzoquinol methylase
MLTSKLDPKVANFWDVESRNWGKKYGKRTSYFYRCRTIYQLFGSTGLRHASILDYGCGSGDITFPMVQDGHSVTGVDIAEGMVRKAIKRAEEFGLGSNASYHHLNDRILSRILSQKYDAIICSSVLEYVEEDMPLVRTFHSMLKDGGFFLVSVPDSKSLFCKLDRWLYANRHWIPRVIPLKKLGYLDIQKRQYDIGLFIDAIEKMGFKLLKRKYNTITLQRGALMERISNIPGMGMLVIMMFQKTHENDVL